MPLHSDVKSRGSHAVAAAFERHAVRWTMPPPPGGRRGGCMLGWPLWSFDGRRAMKPLESVDRLTDNRQLTTIQTRTYPGFSFGGGDRGEAPGSCSTSWIHYNYCIDSFLVLITRFNDIHVVDKLNVSPRTPARRFDAHCSAVSLLVNTL